ncbi:hypothetical protein BPNPMPFG_002513 [Mesorhizobium sp. AR07]|uniref:hypothetical protein n=1 Tax=Mesorhizobium sp. AR07 TaxID=2865838 RepID=UPI00215E1E31|nr:hypothetical protein [Mesorhizobium sp. AR07]UVK46803.1 hypothetical protein BPNPMPFG_002513 [Mesorhizobium sp. AR07]
MGEARLRRLRGDLAAVLAAGAISLSIVIFSGFLFGKRAMLPLPVYPSPHVFGSEDGRVHMPFTIVLHHEINVIYHSDSNNNN